MGIFQQPYSHTRSTRRSSGVRVRGRVRARVRVRVRVRVITHQEHAPLVWG